MWHLGSITGPPALESSSIVVEHRLVCPRHRDLPQSRGCMHPLHRQVDLTHQNCTREVPLITGFLSRATAKTELYNTVSHCLSSPGSPSGLQQLRIPDAGLLRRASLPWFPDPGESELAQSNLILNVPSAKRTVRAGKTSPHLLHLQEQLAQAGTDLRRLKRERKALEGVVVVRKGYGDLQLWGWGGARGGSGPSGWQASILPMPGYNQCPVKASHVPSLRSLLLPYFKLLCAMKSGVTSYRASNYSRSAAAFRCGARNSALGKTLTKEVANSMLRRHEWGWAP